MQLTKPDPRPGQTRASMSSDSVLVQLQQTLYNSRNPTRRWLRCSRRDWISDALRSAACQGVGRTCAIEIGPGSGVYLPLQANLYHEVIATDIEEDYIRHARHVSTRHSNVTLLIDDIMSSKLPSACADLVLCTEVIEHMADSRSAIKQMRRVLRPGGLLVLSTPRRYSPLELAAKIAFLPGLVAPSRFIYKEPGLETGHINLLTAPQIIRQLDEAGFEIQQRHTSGMYLPLVAEFSGETGLRLEKWLESRLQNSPLAWLLWTQYYIARA